MGPTSLELFPAPQLTCGPPVNETFYDHLEGIANREYHPSFVEEEVALIFKKSEMEEIDLGLIESNLKRAIEEVCHAQILLHKKLHAVVTNDSRLQQAILFATLLCNTNLQ